MTDLITDVLEEVLVPVFQSLFRVIGNTSRKIWSFGKTKILRLSK